MPSHSRLAVPTLLLVGVGSALIYFAALLRFPLLEIYVRPLQNLDKLTGSAPGAGLIIFACVLLLFAGYSLGALTLRNKPQGAATTLLVVVPPLLFVAMLLLVYPTTSLDIYDYLFRGRMAVRYGANNFVQVPADYGLDPLMASTPFRFIPWSRAVTAYGPLWEAMSYVTAWLGGERLGPMPVLIDPSLRQLMLAYKALGALGFLGCGAAIWSMLRGVAPEQRWLGLYLWLWNPLVLWESVAAAHNDAWMALAIVVAIWFVSGRRGDRRQGDKETRRQDFLTLPLSTSPALPFSSSPLFLRSVAGLLALTLGGLIKYLALIFGPIVLAASLRRLPTWRARLTLVLVGGALCAGLVMLAYAPFWAGWGTLRNFGDRGALFYASWLAALQAWLGELGLLPKEHAQGLASSLATVLLLFGVAWSAFRAWRAPNRIAEHALWLLLWFLLVCNPWFQPWYLLWALALAALQPERGRVLVAVVLFCATSMLSYIAGSFLLPLLGWPSESAAWNTLLSLLIYLPPLAALAAGRARWFFVGERAEGAEVRYT